MRGRSLSRRGLAGMALVLAMAGPGAPTWAAGQATEPYADHIATAAERSGLAPDLIRAVLQLESAGQVRAVSRAGAMGLMQLMPGTWREWRERLGLGTDPFDPADNIMVGAAYLRFLRDRYGEAGFLAAYNAGPGRYEQSLAGRALPPETLAYVARLSSRRGSVSSPVDWRTVGIFPNAWTPGLGPSRSVGGLFPQGDLAGNGR